MPSQALILVRETGGVAAFAEALASEFGYRFLGNEAAVEALAVRGLECELIDAGEAARLLVEERDLSLVLANFVEVETAGRAHLSWKAALAGFDRGIVEVIRKAAWAVERVAVLGNAAEYAAGLAELREQGGRFSQAFRVRRATAALRAASEFDFAVAQYLEVHGAEAPDLGALSGYAKALRLTSSRAELLEAGENAHQLAALYGSFYEHFRQVSGGKPRYGEVLTISRAAYLIGEFERPTAALLRDGKVITLRSGSTLESSVEPLLRYDEADGAWLVVNGSLGERALAEALQAGLGGILAPDFTEAETALLAEAKVSAWASVSGLGYEALQEVRSVAGGFLVQDRDRAAINPMEWQTLSLAQPLVEDWESLLLGAKVVRHADSAALAVLRGERLIALESGHVSARRAWQAVEESGIGLANTVAVFDGPAVPGSVIEAMKALGVRTVLVAGLAGRSDLEELRQAANGEGLVLLGSVKSLMRL